MSWRIVKQPNGLYARFSEIVDDFTHVNMTRRQIRLLCHRLKVDPDVITTKIENAMLLPFDSSKYPNRYEEAMQVITNAHGERHAMKRRIETR